ncbi:MAG: TonB family protein [Deltaproteobacteria bacterium]|nr:TonB family protein [Deltaproteobacteria bacterium]
MMTKKFIIPFVLASLAVHALVLALTSGVHWWTNPPRPEQVMTVELQSPQGQAAHPPATHRAAQTPAVPGLIREDSVALQDQHSRYDAYLLTIRQNIEARWIYPPQALAERKEGNTLVRFSIDANGALTDCQVLGTSGSASLDAGALSVVRAAAPYAPLPADFNLARLHITATFSYRMQ